MFLIVLSHVVQSLSLTETSTAYYPDVLLDLDHSTTDLTRLFIAAMRYCGAFGNSIFFLCSAWFLLDKKTNSVAKVCRMAADLGAISLGVLAALVIFCPETVSANTVAKMILPVFFGTNWYVPCYILFSLFYPYLNLLIDRLGKGALLRVAVFLGVLYVVIYYVRPVLYASAIFLWISLYFIMAYVKRYLSLLAASRKFNLIMLAVGAAGNTLVITLTNFLGLKLSFLSDKLQYWHSNASPFLLMMAFALLNLARSVHFKSGFVNGFSSLTLAIYLLHENLFMVIYLRPVIWHCIFERFGRGGTMLWILLFSVALFAASAAVAFLYTRTVGRLAHKLADAARRLSGKLYRKAEGVFLRKTAKYDNEVVLNGKIS